MTLLRPIALYSTKTGVQRNYKELRLAVFERKVLRKMYIPTFDIQIKEWRKHIITYSE